MRHKRLYLIGLILLGLEMKGLQAQTLYVKEGNGTQTAYTLSSVRKLTFSAGNVTVLKTDNSTSFYALSGLRYLNFTNLTTGNSETRIQLGHSNLITYPNPLTDVLNIDLTGVIGKGTISILTLEGKTIQTQNTSGNSIVTLYLSRLIHGFYICCYSNASEIKSVIIIKQ